MEPDGYVKTEDHLRVRSFIPVFSLALALVPSTSTAGPLSLYDWMGVAPVIVAAQNHGTYGKYAEFTVEKVYRMRRQISSLAPVRAMQTLLETLGKHPTNQAFLDSIPD